MFETDFANFLRAASLVFCMTSPVAMAQTITQIADAQRAKVAEELRATTAVPVPAPAASAVDTQSRVPPEVRRPPEKVQPAITVHGIYIREGKYVAELTDGHRLVTAAPGMRFKRMKVESVDGAGVHLQAVGKCKGCASERVVAVGGAL